MPKKVISDIVQRLPRIKGNYRYISYPGSRWYRYDGILQCDMNIRGDSYGGWLRREQKVYSDDLLIDGLCQAQVFLVDILGQEHSEAPDVLYDSVIDFLNQSKMLAPSVAFIRHRERSGLFSLDDAIMRIRELLFVFSCVQLYILGEKYENFPEYEKANIGEVCKKHLTDLIRAQRVSNLTTESNMQRKLDDQSMRLIAKWIAEKLYRQEKSSIKLSQLEYVICYDSCFTAICFRLLQILSYYKDQPLQGEIHQRCPSCREWFTITSEDSREYCDECGGKRNIQRRYREKQQSKNSVTRLVGLTIDFTLPNQNGYSCSLSDFNGQYVILYFYPTYDGIVCRKQTRKFQNYYKLITERNAVIIGVSQNTVEQNARFSKVYEIPYPLLSDTTAKTIKAYKSLPKRSHSKKSDDVKKDKNQKRELTTIKDTIYSAFLINPNGQIVKAISDIDPENSAMVMFDLLCEYVH